MTLCTSTNCPYIKECARKSRNDVDEKYDTYYDYQLGGCDEINGYSNFMKGDELESVISDL